MPESMAIARVPRRADAVVVGGGCMGTSIAFHLARRGVDVVLRSEEHTSELQSQSNLVCRLLLEKKKHHLRPSLPHPHVLSPDAMASTSSPPTRSATLPPSNLTLHLSRTLNHSTLLSIFVYAS